MKGFNNFINEKYELVVSLRHAKDAIDAFNDGGWKRMAKMQGSDVYRFKNEDDMFGFYDTLVKDWSIPEDEITIEESVKESRKITLKRRYTDNHPAVTAGKTATVRNKMLEAIADGKITQEEFNNILKEYSKDSSKWMRRNASYFNVSEDGISLSTFGKRALKQVTVNEGNAFIYAAAKAKQEGKDEFEFNGKTYKVTLKTDTNLKENKNNHKMENKFVFESFSEFVKTLNNSLEESLELNEAFKSAKLASILTGANATPKDLAKAFYNMTKISLSEIQDVDIIEMDPNTAKKEKRENAVYFYFTTNEKPNPYAGDYSYDVKTIPANTLLAVTDGKNQWLEMKWERGNNKTLKVGDRDDSVGFQKGGTQDKWKSGISALSKVAELADRAYVMDLDVLKARYSTAAKISQRNAAKAGATAFKDDKQFKAENMARYHTILANRAAQMPIDEEVKKAIDVISQQIKDGISDAKTGTYGDVIIGMDPKNREVRLRDASNFMNNLLDDFSRYVEYTNNAEREKKSGYTGGYYEAEVKNYAKSITDKLRKVEKMDYVW